MAGPGAGLPAGSAPRVASVEAFVLVASLDHVDEHGLGVIAPRPEQARPPRRALAETGTLHVCAYPPQAQTSLVRITLEDGTVGWGKAHAPLGPRATKAVIEDVLAPLLVGQDPLAACCGSPLAPVWASRSTKSGCGSTSWKHVMNGEAAR